jgi:hypothetical protein
MNGRILKMQLKFRVGEFPSDFGQAIANEVRAACCRRQTAAAKGGGRRELTPQLIQQLEQTILHAASHAALGCIPNKIARRGFPPDNARIILAHDIQRALTDLGLSDALRFVHPHQSLAVELYFLVAKRVWPHHKDLPLNPRSTFRRMKDANISN